MVSLPWRGWTWTDWREAKGRAFIQLRGSEILRSSGRFATLSPPLPTPRFSAKRPIGLPLILAIAGYVGGFACVLNFGDVPPAIGLAAVEIGEPVDLG